MNGRQASAALKVYPDLGFRAAYLQEHHRRALAKAGSERVEGRQRDLPDPVTGDCPVDISSH